MADDDGLQRLLDSPMSSHGGSIVSSPPSRNSPSAASPPRLSSSPRRRLSSSLRLGSFSGSSRGSGSLREKLRAQRAHSDHSSDGSDASMSPPSSPLGKRTRADISSSVSSPADDALDVAGAPATADARNSPDRGLSEESISENDAANEQSEGGDGNSEDRARSTAFRLSAPSLAQMQRKDKPAARARKAAKRQGGGGGRTPSTTTTPAANSTNTTTSVPAVVAAAAAAGATAEVTPAVAPAGANTANGVRVAARPDEVAKYKAMYPWLDYTPAEDPQSYPTEFLSRSQGATRASRRLPT